MIDKKLFSELLYIQVALGLVPILYLTHNAEIAMKKCMQQSTEAAYEIRMETLEYMLLLIFAEALVYIVLALIIRGKINKRIGNYLMPTTICAIILIFLFGSLIFMAKVPVIN